MVDLPLIVFLLDNSHLLQVGEQQRSKTLFVNSLRSMKLWVPHPNHHGNLDPEIEGNETDNDRKQRLENIQKRKDHPICEPLRNVITDTTIHGLERHVRRVEEAYQIHQQLRTPDQTDRQENQHGDSHKEQRFRVAGLSFKLLQFF